MTRPVTLAAAREALKAQLETSTARCRALNTIDEALAHVEQASVDPDETLDVLRELLMPTAPQPVSAALLRELEPLTPARHDATAIEVTVDAIDDAALRQALETEILPRLDAHLRAVDRALEEERPPLRHRLATEMSKANGTSPVAPPTEAVAPVDPRRDLEADQVLLDALATGHKTLTQLGKVAKKRGELLKKAIDRTHYRLQRLIAECKVLRIQRGLYALVPPPPPRPSPTTRHAEDLEVAWNGSMKTPLPGCSGGHLGSSLSAEAGLIR